MFLDPGAPADRQNWAVARAVAVHLKPDFVHALGVPPEQKGGLWGESLTTLIAQRLLLPTRWFAADARSCAYDLEELKRRYGTAGHEVIGWRLLDLPAPCVITIVENDHVSHRKSNAWRVPRDLSRPERECQQYVSYYSRARVVRQEGWTVQGWPVHQPDWKREVLRSVLDVADLD